ncbi:hypothetical protein LINPERPRIM_LOCUS32113 [Linum perenne]
MGKQGRTLWISSSQSFHSLYQLPPSSCPRRTWWDPLGICTRASKTSLILTFNQTIPNTEFSIHTSCTLLSTPLICSPLTV